jgi:hypothetical protein
MHQQPQKEHKWLHKLVGDWTFEIECDAGPDQPKSISTGTESVRSFGGIWTIGDGLAPGPDGAEFKSIMTLGYDPQKKKFVGTFIGTMMTNLWVYEGSLDAAEKILTLDTEGPSFTDPTKIVKYQDIIEFISDDERTLSSQSLGDDGKWTKFMKATYRRKK